MKAIWDNSRALDLLSELPYVDHTRGFGAIGHSLGGHNAIYTAVLDDRISVLASSCGFDSYLDYFDGDVGRWYFGKGWCKIRYMPFMSDYRGRLEEIPFDFHELLGALAPRPMFVNAPLHDSNFRWSSVDQCALAANAVYKLLGGDGNLTIKHPDSKHDFPEEIAPAGLCHHRRRSSPCDDKGMRSRRVRRTSKSVEDWVWGCDGLESSSYKPVALRTG